MSGRLLLFFESLLVVIFIGISCKNDATTAKKTVSDNIPDISNTAAPAAKQTAAPPADTRPAATQKVPELKPNQDATPIPDYSNLPGPKGYITRDNSVLRKGPTQRADQVGILKQHEAVYILETTMRNEEGTLTDYPTWHKIERQNKQRGWVVAAAVDTGGGG